MAAQWLVLALLGQAVQSIQVPVKVKMPSQATWKAAAADVALLAHQQVPSGLLKAMSTLKEMQTSVSSMLTTVTTQQTQAITICTNTTQTVQSQIDAMNLAINTAQAQSANLAVSTDQLNATAASDGSLATEAHAQLQQLQAQEQADAVAYAKDIQQLNDAISALQQALQTVQSGGNAFAFLQAAHARVALDALTSPAAHRIAKLFHSLLQRVDPAALQAKMDTYKKLPDDPTYKLQAKELLQAVLQEVLDTFNQELREKVAEQQKKKADVAAQKQLLQAQIQQAKLTQQVAQDRSHVQTVVLDGQVKDLAATVKDRDAAHSYVQTMSSSCETKVTSFQSTITTLKQEITTLNQAVDLLAPLVALSEKDKPTAQAAAPAAAPAPAFFQLASHSFLSEASSLLARTAGKEPTETSPHAETAAHQTWYVAPPAAAPAPANPTVQQLLDRAQDPQDQLQDLTPAELASLQSTLEHKMADLRTKQASDAQLAVWCNVEGARQNSSMAAAESDLGLKTAEVARLQGAIDKVQLQVAQLNATLSQLADQRVEMLAARQNESRSNQDIVASNTAAADAIDQALDILQSSYGGSSFVEIHKVQQAQGAEPAPVKTASQRAGSGRLVISLLTRVARDFRQMAHNIQFNDQEGARDLRKNLQDLDGMVKAAQKDMQSKQDLIQDSNNNLQAAMTAVSQSQANIQQVNGTAQSLSTRCANVQDVQSGAIATDAAFQVLRTALDKVVRVKQVASTKAIASAAGAAAANAAGEIVGKAAANMTQAVENAAHQVQQAAQAAQEAAQAASQAVETAAAIAAGAPAAAAAAQTVVAASPAAAPEVVAASPAAAFGNPTTTPAAGAQGVTTTEEAEEVTTKKKKSTTAAPGTDTESDSDTAEISTTRKQSGPRRKARSKAEAESFMQNKGKESPEIQTLREVRQEVQKDFQQDIQHYTEWKLYCNQNLQTQSQDLSNEDAQVQLLSSQNASGFHEKIQIAYQKGKLEEALTRERASLQEAIKMRNQTAALNQQKMEELRSNIEALTAAQQVLSNPGAFAAASYAAPPAAAATTTQSAQQAQQQLLWGNLNQAQLLAVADQVQKALLSLSAENMKEIKSRVGKESPAMQEFLSSPKTAMLKASKATALAQTGKASKPAGTDSILMVINALLDSFQADLKDAMANEAQQSQTFLDLSSSKTEQIAILQQELASKQQQMAVIMAQTAESGESKAYMQVAENVDQSSLATLQQECSAVAAEFNQRNASRNAEIAAIDDAILYLMTIDVPNPAAAAVAQAIAAAPAAAATSLSATAAATVAQASLLADPMLKAQAQGLKRRSGLRRALAAAEGDQTGPMPFAQQAALEAAAEAQEAMMALARVKNGHRHTAPGLSALGKEKITQVLARLDALAAQMKTDKAAEATMKDSCNKELHQAQLDFDELQNQAQLMNSTVIQMQTSVGTMESQMQQINSQINDSNKLMADAVTVHKKAKDENKAARDRLSTRIAAVDKAIQALSKKYSLIQKPGGWATAAGPNQKGKLVLQRLQQINQANKDQLSSLQQEDSQVEIAYQQSLATSSQAVIAKKTEIIVLAQAKTDAQAQLASKNATLISSQLLTQQVGTYLLVLKQKCQPLLDKFDANQQARAQEIATVQKAKGFLAQMVGAAPAAAPGTTTVATTTETTTTTTTEAAASGGFGFLRSIFR